MAHGQVARPCLAPRAKDALKSLTEVRNPGACDGMAKYLGVRKGYGSSPAARQAHLREQASPRNCGGARASGQCKRAS